MAGLDKMIEKIVKVPVIDGLVCALMMIESLVKYGIEMSKIAKYKEKNCLKNRLIYCEK